MNSGSIDSSNISASYQAIFEEMKADGLKGPEAKNSEAVTGAGVAAENQPLLASSQSGLSSSLGSSDSSGGNAWRLPEVTGSGATAGAMGEKAGWMVDISDSALMFNALWEMARSSQQDLSTAKEIKNAMHTSKIDAKKTAIAETENQIEAERDAAWEAFGSAVAGAVVSFGVGLVAANGWLGVTKGSEVAAALSASAQGWGSATTALGNAISKNSGAQRDADDAKLRVKRAEMQEAIFDDAIDTFKGAYEEAKEQYKLALRIIQEHFELKSQVIQKVTS